jgi:hypothetical protein
MKLKGEVFLCDHCWRVVDGRLKSTSMGNMIVPEAHRNERGQFCDGVNGEVIRGWGAAA